jgi:hypothetical protein
LPRIKLSVKSTTDLSLSMAIKTDHGEIALLIVVRVFINVMNLYRLSANAANTTSSIRDKKDKGSSLGWNFFSSLFLHGKYLVYGLTVGMTGRTNGTSGSL